MTALKPLKGGMSILMPPPNKCQVCAVEHDPKEPHNKDSLFYQFVYAQDHDGKSPTWEEAMAHCSQEVKQKWITALAQHGIIVELTPPSEQKTEQS